MDTAIPTEQLMRYLNASAEQRAVIDRYLLSGNPCVLVAAKPGENTLTSIAAMQRETLAVVEELRDEVKSVRVEHQQLRKELIARGYLGPASVWKSGHAKIDGYTP